MMNNNVANPALLSRTTPARASRFAAAPGMPCYVCGRRTALKCAACGKVVCGECSDLNEDLDRICVECI